ncbi:MAG: ABC transporter permease [Myxococcaceae bacterium]|nr:ABC transporter permease [Myxococcaceae bacterium]
MNTPVASAAARWGLLFYAVLVLGADFFASPLPLSVRVDGQTHWFPNVLAPAALAGQTQTTLKPRAEWMLSTLVPFGPEQIEGSMPNRADVPPYAPDAAHWLGTDELGRDVLARLIHGARRSMAWALVAVVVSFTVGAAIGALAGYFGRGVDALLSRLIDVMLMFPSLLFLLACLALWRQPGPMVVALALALARWADVARLVRAEVRRVKVQDFVRAAEAMGASKLYVLRKHVLPHAIAPLWVAAPLALASAVLVETGLSFLGLGTAPPQASWGELLNQASRYLTTPGAWWLAVFPGLLVFGVVWCLEIVAEQARRALDEGR